MNGVQIESTVEPVDGHHDAGNVYQQGRADEIALRLSGSDDGGIQIGHLVNRQIL